MIYFFIGIGSNCLVIVTSSGRLIRWTVPGPPPTMASQCVDLLPRLLSRSPRGTEFADVVRDVHLDFSGWHAIVTVSASKTDRNTQSTWYVHGTATKPRELRKLKHHVVKSVAWNRSNGDSEKTSQILMGTSTGCILGMQLDRVSGSKSSTARLIEVHVLYKMEASVRGFTTCVENRTRLTLSYHRYRYADSTRRSFLTSPTSLMLL